MMCINEVLLIEVYLVKSGEVLGGIGELGMVVIVVVLLNVIFVVIGMWLCKLLVGN